MTTATGDKQIYSYDTLKRLGMVTTANASGTTTKTYTYTYDAAGNILSEKKNGTTVNTYTYGDAGWKDLLTAVNGTSLTYDKSGNPRLYVSASGIVYDMYWTNGRQLETFQTRSGPQMTVYYGYDADGIRNYKDVDREVHNYVTQNGKIVRETIDGTTILDFIYDNQGRPFALNYSTDGGRTFNTYYYVLNLQGDVVQLVEISIDVGKVWEYDVVARYTYNAWGEVLTATGKMAELNPLRYRGYYYDTETGFYYLQSRYYDPVTHRFINADGLASTGQGFIGTNMFAYCLNNPMMYVDMSGTDAILLLDSNFPTHVGALIEDEDGNWWHFYWGAATGFSRVACVIGIEVAPLTWCVSYTDDLSLEAINESHQFGGDYEDMIYLEGDFSKSASLAQNVTGEYTLYSKNCSQYTLKILAQSDTKYKNLLLESSRAVYPNSAFDNVKEKYTGIVQTQKRTSNMGGNIRTIYREARI